MRLSEAIRLGSMLRPQAYGALFIDGASCAKGAACEATGYAYRVVAPMSHFHGSEEHLFQAFPSYKTVNEMPCPVCGMRERYTGTIAHLNDHACDDKHAWTREAIADWVATIEPAESPEHSQPESVPVIASAL